MVSPGMIQRPTAAITICTDRTAADDYGFPPNAVGPYIDVGTAAATMMLAAHALGVGAGPVSSFSHAAVGVALRLPAGWSPDLILCLGHAAPTQPAPVNPNRSLRWQDLTTWVPADRPTGR
jgi:nitroreductase